MARIGVSGSRIHRCATSAAVVIEFSCNAQTSEAFDLHSSPRGHRVLAGEPRSCGVRNGPRGSRSSAFNEGRRGMLRRCRDGRRDADGGCILRRARYKRPSNPWSVAVLGSSAIGCGRTLRAASASSRDKGPSAGPITRGSASNTASLVPGLIRFAEGAPSWFVRACGCPCINAIRRPECTT
jgi:hypothetical protein